MYPIGMPLTVHRDETTKNLRCTSFVGKDHGQIIAAGCQREILKIDVEKGRVIDKVRVE